MQETACAVADWLTMDAILRCAFWCLPPLVHLLSLHPAFAAAGASAYGGSLFTGNETDRLSLLAFKDGITGDPAGTLTSWNSSSHHCRRKGVTCARRHPDRVKGLALRALRLSGRISPSLTNLTFLRVVDLSDNRLTGDIPPQVGGLRRLRYLNLSFNTLRGELPSNLSSCSELLALVLWSNQLVGRIPTALGSLQKLVRLNLDFNRFSGPIPPSLGNLSSETLGVLSFGGNALSGNIPSELGGLTKLHGLGMSFNFLSGILPPSLFNLSNLVVLEFVLNKLSGELPSSLGTSLPKLTYLEVTGNHFHGTIPSSLSNASSLQTLNMGGNMFSGTIPGDLGLLSELKVFTVAKNRLQARESKDWEFLTSLTNCSSLKRLEIFLNDLQGVLPASITNLSSSLERLQIHNNRISGSIPARIGDIRGLMELTMHENKLQGTIPPSLGELNQLIFLILGGNQLEGNIPPELGNLTRLNLLGLFSNSLSGAIPTSFGRLIQCRELEFSLNSFSGKIPKELFAPFTLTSVDLSNNLFEGSLPSNIGQLINLQILDVSVNKLSGNIPSVLGDCRNLEVLALRGNSFNGTIPPSLLSLKGIQKLDLSANKLSGEIPKSLETLKLLDYLNLSFNGLTGEVPQKGLFANASRFSVQGNEMLCGGIPQLQLHLCTYKQTQRKAGAHLSIIVISVVVVGLCSLLLSGLVIYRYRNKSKSKATSTTPSFETKLQRISFHDLVKATDDFSRDNFIGRGSFGSVYKGVLADERVIAVKVLDIKRQGAVKSFKYECEALKNIRHRNLVKILSACSSIDFNGNEFRALVFDFLPNGSLERWLHPEPEAEERVLNFNQRLQIAFDVASAMDYLQNHGHSPVIHCDLKPSNILLGDDMTAHVTDFGLARFISATSILNSENQSSTIGIKGTIGYVAPEYGLGSPISTEGDVYSFGILLMELFTAKRPVDDMFINGLSLRRFVESSISIPHGAREAIDPRLILADTSRRERVLDCFVSLMQVGLNCTNDSPSERITMRDILKEIPLIQDAFLGSTAS